MPGHEQHCNAFWRPWMAVSRAEVPQHRSRGKERSNSVLGFHAQRVVWHTVSGESPGDLLGGCAPTYLACFGGGSLAASLVSICSHVMLLLPAFAGTCGQLFGRKR